jgi:NAD(P)-dependent dehydrogenase (short-subunit alcohol dehydrogenase family)
VTARAGVETPSNLAAEPGFAPHALGRYGQPEVIAGAIAALLGDGNRWVTGQRIEVSGGMHL